MGRPSNSSYLGSEGRLQKFLTEAHSEPRNPNPSFARAFGTSASRDVLGTENVAAAPGSCLFASLNFRAPVSVAGVLNGWCPRAQSWTHFSSPETHSGTAPLGCWL